MGFYTYLGDKLVNGSVETEKLVGEFDAKYVGGRELYHWCFENNIEEIRDDYDVIFKLTQEDVRKAITDKAMLMNSDTVLRRLLTQMIDKDIEVIYFYGSY